MNPIRRLNSGKLLVIISNKFVGTVSGLVHRKFRACDSAVGHK